MSDASKIVLVTGGAGYVGAHACKALHSAGYAPVVYDNLSTGHRSAVQWGDLILGDIRDLGAVKSALHQTRASSILHFAAKSEVGESNRIPLDYYDVNVGGAINIAKAAIDCDVENIVFSSSCAVYGLPLQVPINETTDQNPINPYGATKMFAERVFEDAGKSSNLRTVSLRYFNAAGASQDGEIGESHDPETHLIPLTIRASMPGDAELKLMGDDYSTPDGTAVRDYIHVDDLASAHLLALGNLIRGGSTNQFNLGNGVGYSVRDVIEAVKYVSGNDVRYRLVPRRKGDPPMLVADATKAKEILGWQPERTSLSRIVEDAIRWEYQKMDS